MATLNASLESRVRSWLAVREARGLRRTLQEPAGIDLCSNDYLGFARHPDILRRFSAAARHEGVGSTGSRLLRGHRSAFRQVEARFARFKDTSASLFFGSGWAANLGVLPTFLRDGDVVFSDELNHASLIDGMRLARARRVVFPHRDWKALARLLAAEPGDRQKFVVTESVFSMDGDLAPLRRYAELRKRHDFALIVDEAHAVGVYGSTGSGLIEESGCAPDVFLSVNSAGKALGVCGAFVCGPAWAIDFLAQTARSFVFSTAPPPAVVAAIDAALDLLEGAQERRRRVRGYGIALRKTLEAGPGDSPIVPIVLGSRERAVRAAGMLQSAGYDVRAIRPPTVPEGTSRLRVSLHASLGERRFQRFANDLLQVLREATA